MATWVSFMAAFKCNGVVRSTQVCSTPRVLTYHDEDDHRKRVVRVSYLTYPDTALRCPATTWVRQQAIYVTLVEPVNPSQSNVTGEHVKRTCVS